MRFCHKVLSGIQGFGCELTRRATPRSDGGRSQHVSKNPNNVNANNSTILRPVSGATHPRQPILQVSSGVNFESVELTAMSASWTGSPFSFCSFHLNFCPYFHAGFKSFSCTQAEVLNFSREELLRGSVCVLYWTNSKFVHSLKCSESPNAYFRHCKLSACLGGWDAFSCNTW